MMLAILLAGTAALSLPSMAASYSALNCGKVDVRNQAETFQFVSPLAM